MHKIIILIFLFHGYALSQKIQVQEPIRYLALGDSYTIGESVDATQRWPVQLMDSLTAKGLQVDTLVINARTGRTTPELLEVIKGKKYEHQNFNLVSVLIGVNDQYQNKPIADYPRYFREVLDSALRYVHQDTGQVFVLSIPDYAYTPFGQNQNPTRISREIDQYNEINKRIAEEYQISYFDITPISRWGLDTALWTANDGLHPSARQYTAWVELILQHLVTQTRTKSGFKGENFKIFPNPAHQWIQMTHSGNLEGPYDMQLMDIRGNVVKEKNDISARALTIDLLGLQEGHYLVCAIDSKGRYCQKLQIVD